MNTLNEPRDDRGLSATFQRAMGGVGADLGPLVAGAAERGRRIRRRRRAAAGTVAAAVALTAGGLLALRPDDGTSAAPATVSVFPAPLPKPPSGPERQQPGSGADAGKVAMTGRATVHTLMGTLPAGGTTSGYAGHFVAAGLSPGPGTTPVPGGPNRPFVVSRGSLFYDDGNGPAAVTVTVEGGFAAQAAGPAVNPADAFYDSTFSCAEVNAAHVYQYCHDTVLPDGSRLLLIEQARGEELSRSAVLLRADDTQVRVNVSNTATVADAAPPARIRDGLPLTVDQVRAIATATGFQEWITPEAAQQAERAVQPFHEESDAAPPAGPTDAPAPVR
ncbi:hypothetical protein ACFXAF_27930 [Kitasatospora sp. NPDC059463]|uniref:hypothetical protein n=1 Tax=unclassified Kitasatospora TaxID=2633591 RepID=UPI0036AE5CB5